MQGLQRQISFEEKRGKANLASMAENTRRSMSEQQQRIQEIAGQGVSRIQQTRDEGLGKITSVQRAAVQVNCLFWNHHCSERHRKNPADSHQGA